MLRHRSFALVAVLVGAAIVAGYWAGVRFPTGGPAADVAARTNAPLSPAPAGVAGEPYGGGLAVTPPMGWNGFNHFQHNVTADTVRAMAQVIATSGMRALGYTYVNLDGGWDLPTRSAAGELVPDPKKFPDGIRAVANYVHALGLKFGIYASAGITNCAQTSAGSYGHYADDAAAFASWGVDYVKLDWCWVPFDLYPGMSHSDLGLLLGREFGAAILHTGRPMMLDLNYTEFASFNWAPTLANMWRTAPDIRANFQSVLWNFTTDVNLYRFAGPDHWNDPDMLEIGNRGMSLIEQRTQFSLWAEMAAPLIAGNDLTKMSHDAFAVLTNSQVIKVDQDALGVQGYPVTNRGGHWVLTKPLADGSRAIVLFDATGQPALISTTLDAIGMSGSGRYQLRDLWSGAVLTTTGPIAALVPPHGVAMYVVSPA